MERPKDDMPYTPFENKAQEPWRELWAAHKVVLDSAHDEAAFKRCVKDCLRLVSTRCAMCATSMATSLRCANCKTIYCSKKCQAAHWKRGGHKARCREIARLGAEQDYADRRAADEAAKAARACEEDCEGLRCFVCLGDEAGLVRGCGCRGAAGAAHLRCLAKFAKIKVEEDGRQEFWYDCRVCGQSYHGPVQIAMAWEVWREYRGRPDGDRCKALAVNTLAQGAFAAGDFALALRFFLAHIAIGRLYFRDGVLDCAVKHFPEVSGCLQALGERAAALALDQLTLTCCTAAFGPEDIRALLCARNVAVSLSRHGEHHGAIALLREKIPVCARAFGDDHETTMTFRSVLCKALLAGDRIAAAVKADARGGRLGDLVLEIAEAAVLAERAVAFSTRFYGVAHPTTNNRRQDLAVARQELENFGMKEKLAELGAEGLRARLRAEIDAAGPG